MRKSEAKGPFFFREIGTWKYNIKIYFKIIEYVNMDLIHLEQARGPWMGCRAHGNEEFCLTL